jgi:hypothetical protein
MKILTLFLLIALNLYSQSDSTDIDASDTWQPTKVFANHSKYKNHLLDILYSKKLDIIVDMVKTKGFTGLYYLNDYDGVDLKSNVSSDSITNVLNKFTKDLPKDRTKVKVDINESNFLSEVTSFEEYTYIKKNTTYFIRFVYINAQMKGIYLNIHCKY